LASACLDIEFIASPAEEIELAQDSFDLVSAGQSWLYLDADAMIPRVLRLLRPNGLLALMHLLWLPERDEIARQSEALVLKYNPDWAGAGYGGGLTPLHSWAPGHFELRTFHTEVAALEFTRESWCGRIRACRGVGASLSDAEVERFDEEHRRMLESVTDETFGVLHQMTLHVYAPMGYIRAV